MSKSVLPQLQEVIKDLESQETALSTQLTDVQVKLKGVRAVLPMFGEPTAGLIVFPEIKACCKNHSEEKINQ